MALTLETPTRTGLFSFPNPVNETSARLVALGAVAQSILFLVVREWWVLVPLTYGFVARVLTGPTLSPWGTIVTRFITPRITREHRFVPGPPKRFAQGIGAVFTVGASVAWALGEQRHLDARSTTWPRSGRRQRSAPSAARDEKRDTRTK